ncbi:MAG TPA: succinate--CoA ligase subunit alpha [bacterium]|jgi:succinyl-CoA synthetase alpha subunit|nr:succinate--CoA ligase subunit alpha [bacterium]
MSIIVNKNTKVLCQGVGKAGSFHLKGCKDYGTKMVGGVQPKKGGTTVEGLPVFNTVRQAVLETGADASMIFVPAPGSADAILEAADAGIKTIVCITEGVPVLDMSRTKAILKADYPGVRLIGPNCPGIITPGECKIGIMPGYIHKKGKVGILSKSGTLTYEAVHQTTAEGFGQTTCVGIGGDPILGSTYLDLLPLFESDPETEVIVLIGEIGGDAEKSAAEYWKAHMKKPVVAFVAGRTAPAGKRMGHAGAIIGGADDTADAKLKMLASYGIHTVDNPSLIGKEVAKVLAKH